MKGKGHSDGLRRPLNAKAAAAAEVAKREAELRAQYVVVPPGDEAKPVSCPICKETLSAEFFEDDEDWVWKNAVMKDDKVNAHFILFKDFLRDSSLFFWRFSGLSCDLSCRSCRLDQQSGSAVAE